MCSLQTRHTHFHASLSTQKIHTESWGLCSPGTAIIQHWIMQNTSVLASRSTLQSYHTTCSSSREREACSRFFTSSTDAQNTQKQLRNKLASLTVSNKSISLAQKLFFWVATANTHLCMHSLEIFNCEARLRLYN